MGCDVTFEETVSSADSSGCGRFGRESPTSRLYPLRPSLFPHVPPYVQFIPVAGNTEFLVEPPSEMREMLWLVPSAPWHTISNCAETNGFTVSETRIRQFEGNIRNGAIWDSLPITEKNADVVDFQKLNEMVKINQFPAMHELGRKDNLFKNFNEMKKKYGKADFNFMPLTFMLPTDKKKIQRFMAKHPDLFWIVKPPNLFCGMGIRVVDKFQEIPNKKSQLCVQSYIKNPLLINKLKFDLRIYVLITSVDPLRVYVYKEGLTRFATEEYTNDPEMISNNFIHLTNFSINKESDNFVNNSNPDEPEGSKWTLTSLWKYFRSIGVETEPIWTKMIDIIIKSILSAYHPLTKAFRDQVSSSYSCYKMLGYDILLDTNLKPHLIEINTIPSLAAKPDTIDSFVKNPLVAEMFNIAGFHVPKHIAFKSGSTILEKIGWNHDGLKPMGHDKRLYTKLLNYEDLEKQEDYTDCDREEYLESILEDLSPYDVRQLIMMEDEQSQTKLFTKVWPTSETHNYFKYLDEVSYGEKLMDAFEYYYGDHREEGHDLIKTYCEMKTHLRVKVEHPKPDPDKNESNIPPPMPKVAIPSVFLGGM